MTDALVVDASAMVALVDDDVRKAAVRARLAQGRALHATTSMPFEVANALRKRHTRDLPQARRLHQMIELLSIQLWPWEAVRHRVWQLAGHVAASDAGYVAIAESLDAVLLTSDTRLARAPGIRCRVELV